MTNFVMGLLIVQLLGGAYQLTFVLGAGQKLSNARATRLPDFVVVGHLTAALTATALWVVWMATHEDVFAWATLAVLLVTSAGGLFMFARTARQDSVVDRPAVDPADVRVAEKQIPATALAVHGLGAVVLLACVLLEALGVT